MVKRGKIVILRKRNKNTLDKEVPTYFFGNKKKWWKPNKYGWKPKKKMDGNQKRWMEPRLWERKVGATTNSSPTE